MQKNVYASITVPYLTSVLQEYFKKKDFIITNYLIEPCPFKIGEGKRKKFYKLILEANHDCPDLILKVLPENDVVIASTQDDHHREVAFVESELFQIITQIISIPVVAVYRDESTKEWWVLMEDVTTALKKIGPPKPPNADILRKMLRSLGKFHALSWEQTSLLEKYPWLMDFNQWISSGCQLIQSLIKGYASKPWIEEFLKAKPGLVSGFAVFMNELTWRSKEILKTFVYSPELILNTISHSPKVLSHNDLFFPNLGWRHQELVVIDWELFGTAPACWDIYSAYAGMPCPEIQEKEALDIYFQAIEEEGIEVHREAWLSGYHKLELIEFLAFGLRDLVTMIYNPQSPLSEEKKKQVKVELDRLLTIMEEAYCEINKVK